MNPQIEDRVITRDRGLPNLDNEIMGDVSTIDDCFKDMKKVEYGIRVHVKVVDDKSCDDPRYTSICQRMMDQNRILFEDKCHSTGYVTISYYENRLSILF